MVVIMANTIFDFTRVDNFLDDINRPTCFDTLDMDGVTKNYHFVLAEDCPSNIEDCIDEDGTLITDGDNPVRIIESLNDEDGAVALSYQKGINGERAISIADSSISFDLGDSVRYLKAVFLVSGGLSEETEGTGYVLAYAINNTGIECKDTIILPVDGVVWSIRYGL